MSNLSVMLPGFQAGRIVAPAATPPPGPLLETDMSMRTLEGFSDMKEVLSILLDTVYDLYDTWQATGKIHGNISPDTICINSLGKGFTINAGARPANPNFKSAEHEQPQYQSEAYPPLPHTLAQQAIIALERMDSVNSPFRNENYLDLNVRMGAYSDVLATLPSPPVVPELLPPRVKMPEPTYIDDLESLIHVLAYIITTHSGPVARNLTLGTLCITIFERKTIPGTTIPVSEEILTWTTTKGNAAQDINLEMEFLESSAYPMENITIVTRVPQPIAPVSSLAVHLKERLIANAINRSPDDLIKVCPINPYWGEGKVMLHLMLDLLASLEMAKTFCGDDLSDPTEDAGMAYKDFINALKEALVALERHGQKVLHCIQATFEPRKERGSYFDFDSDESDEDRRQSDEDDLIGVNPRHPPGLDSDSDSSHSSRSGQGFRN
ncbi:hypothetical protein BDZ97DRAFT_1784908 [Flammula alnicola]|nr:hypothetical protein BDZ97DRAFT_1784908 [Flammula alnicola]